MVNCSFTKEVWSFVLQFLHIKKVWGIGKLSLCFQAWIKEMGAWKEVHCFICWEIWRHQNSIIFESCQLSISRVCNLVLKDLGEIEKDKFVYVQRVPRPSILESNILVGFFDGASHNGCSKCGAGAILKCPHIRVYMIKMNCGQGTNSVR
jgi:hypothetical protein